MYLILCDSCHNNNIIVQEPTHHTPDNYAIQISCAPSLLAPTGSNTRLQIPYMLSCLASNEMHRTLSTVVYGAVNEMQEISTGHTFRRPKVHKFKKCIYQWDFCGLEWTHA